MSAMPIIKEKSVKSEILIIWRAHEGTGRGSEGKEESSKRRARVGWKERGREGRDMKKQGNVIAASHPQADEERMNRD